MCQLQALAEPAGFGIALQVTQRTRENEAKARDWSAFSIENCVTRVILCTYLLQSLCDTFHARRFFEKEQWPRAKQRRGRLCLVWMPANIARELLTVSKIEQLASSFCQFM